MSGKRRRNLARYLRPCLLRNEQRHKLLPHDFGLQIAGKRLAVRAEVCDRIISTQNDYHASRGLDEHAKLNFTALVLGHLFASQVFRMVRILNEGEIEV